MDYGLFFAKTVTLLLALLAAVAIVGSAALAKKRFANEDEIEIEKINERFEHYKDTMRHAVLDDDVLKLEKKEDKKKKKAEKKNKKKQSDDEPVLKKKRVFVIEFDGDIKASESEQLRKLVSVVLTEAKADDEIVVKLESQGGMVHSYGFAASQLARIKSKSIPLTVCVDKVAASGGYMMACVADKILAAPFAIIGSIGVVAQIPNFHKLLKKTDIDYEMYTAGEYKRTLTMFAENTDKGREKFVEDLEDTHCLFKDFVSDHRPVVTIEEVATGEIWFGIRAMDKQLIDAIQTSDEYLFALSDSADIYEISIATKQTLVEKLGVSISHGVERSLGKVFRFLQTRYVG